MRWLAGLACAFGGVFGLGIFLTGGAGLVIGPLWGGLVGVLGARIARVGERQDCLLVRNRFATCRVPWEKIAIVDFRARPIGAWMRLRGMRERRCGMLRFDSGDRIWLDATEMRRHWLIGTHYSHTEAAARAGSDHVAAVWHTHRAAV